jgi:hypothetical protein
LRRTAQNLIRSLVLFALAGAASSCGPGRGAYCDAKCECEGCSGAAYDGCLAHDDSDFRSSELRGCLDYYDALVDCQNATAACFGGDFHTSCGPEKDIWKKCMDDRK